MAGYLAMATGLLALFLGSAVGASATAVAHKHPTALHHLSPARVHHGRRLGPRHAAGPAKAVHLALGVDDLALQRPYDAVDPGPAARPMPTRVSYRLMRKGPVGWVGYGALADQRALDVHDVNAAAGGSQFGAPSDVVGASLGYTFK